MAEPSKPNSVKAKTRPLPRGEASSDPKRAPLGADLLRQEPVHVVGLSLPDWVISIVRTAGLAPLSIDCPYDARGVAFGGLTLALMGRDPRVTPEAAHAFDECRKVGVNVKAARRLLHDALVSIAEYPHAEESRREAATFGAFGLACLESPDAAKERFQWMVRADWFLGAKLRRALNSRPFDESAMLTFCAGELWREVTGANNSLARGEQIYAPELPAVTSPTVGLSEPATPPLEKPAEVPNGNVPASVRTAQMPPPMAAPPVTRSKKYMKGDFISVDVCGTITVRLGMARYEHKGAGSGVTNWIRAMADAQSKGTPWLSRASKYQMERGFNAKLARDDFAPIASWMLSRCKGTIDDLVEYVRGKGDALRLPFVDSNNSK